MRTIVFVQVMAIQLISNVNKDINGHGAGQSAHLRQKVLELKGGQKLVYLRVSGPT